MKMHEWSMSGIDVTRYAPSVQYRSVQNPEYMHIQLTTLREFFLLLRAAADLHPVLLGLPYIMVLSSVSHATEK